MNLKKSSPWRFIIILTLILGSGIWWLSLSYQSHLIRMERELLMDEVALDGLVLSRALEQKFTLLNALIAFTEVEPDEKTIAAKFPQFAASLYRSSTGIRALEIFPQGIAKFVYPVEENESFVGWNVFTDKRAWVKADIIRAMNTKKVTISGPNELAQGGLGLITRKAIYKQNRFWGFTAVVVDVPTVLDRSGFNINANIRYAFCRSDGKVFAGDSAVFTANPILTKLPLPEGYWEIAVVPKTGWAAPVMLRVWLMRLFSFLALFFLDTYLYLLLTQRNRLQIMVDARTQDLRDIADELQTITDGLPVFIGHFDMQERILFANNTFHVWFNASREDLVGKTLEEIMGNETYQGIKKHISQVLLGKSVHYETNRLFPDGKTRDIEVTFISDLGHQGKVNGFFALITDISERKRAEEKARATEKRFEYLISENPAVIYSYSVKDEGKVLFVSENVINLLGYSYREFTSQSKYWLELLHPEDKPKVIARLPEIIEKGTLILEYRFQHENGNYIWLHDEAKLVCDKDGKPMEVIGYWINITERKKADDTLRKTHEIYREAISQAEAIPYMKDYATNMYTFIGEGITELTGYSPTEFNGNLFREMIKEVVMLGEAAGITAEEAIQRAQSGEIKKWRNELRIIIRSGETKWLADSSIQIFDEEGKATGSIGFLQNITNRKQAEKELQYSFGKLRRAMAGTIHALASATEMRDPYTAGHQKRVANLSRSIATEMNLSRDIIEGIRIAATVHDIGKIYVPAEILSKPTKLTSIEFDLIKTHPQGAYDILKNIEFPWPIAQIVFQHHERLNGAGYPQGLKSDQILLEAKIIAVADVVEAMATHRPYRPALGIESALDEIKKNSGILYDPNVANACFQVFQKGFIFD